MSKKRRRPEPGGKKTGTPKGQEQPRRGSASPGTLTPGSSPMAPPLSMEGGAPQRPEAEEAAPGHPKVGLLLGDSPKVQGGESVQGKLLEAEEKGGAQDTALTLVPAWPNLIVREAALLLFVLGALLFLALLFPAPLGPPADPLRPENPEKAPWYFVGLQEMASFSTLLGAVVFPALFTVLLLCLPLLPPLPRPLSSLFLGGMGLGAACVTALAEVVSIHMDIPHTLLSPPGVALGMACVVGIGMGRGTRSVRGGVLGALVALGSSYLVFTLVGALCRGPSWIFVWPWKPWPEVGY